MSGRTAEASFGQRHDHEVLEEDWTVSPITRRHRDQASVQPGNTGSGNHCVELGSFTVPDRELGTGPREHLTLLSAGLDEVPMVYKDIHAVMAAQTDLVEVLGRFDPKLVKMCSAGERAED